MSIQLKVRQRAELGWGAELEEGDEEGTVGPFDYAQNRQAQDRRGMRVRRKMRDWEELATGQ